MSLSGPARRFAALATTIFIPVLATFAGERIDIRIDDNWRVKLEEITFNADMAPAPLNTWRDIDIPHQFNDYNTYLGGDTHIYGTALYERHVAIDAQHAGSRVFAWFEGAGHYATVYVNGHEAGHHRGLRVGFSVDLTDHIEFGGDNLLEVRVEYPRADESDLFDLPFMDGGNAGGAHCEGTEPFGIHKPVHIVITGNVRVQYFGTYVFTTNEYTPNSVPLTVWTEVRNHYDAAKAVAVKSEIRDASGSVLKTVESTERVNAGQEYKFVQTTGNLAGPRLWSPDDPYLHTLSTTVTVDGAVEDTYETPFGIRWISWPKSETAAAGQTVFKINDKPVFIKGICEYEHNLGMDHAFTDEMVAASCRMVHSCGFNAFRDAHQPHNLRYYDHWDRYGIVCWPQIESNNRQELLDNKAYTANMVHIVESYVRERRNHPCIVLWGIYNENSISDYNQWEKIDWDNLATKVKQTIADLDPTSPAQRLRANCKGGGLDANYPQHWSGTYGGNWDDYRSRISSPSGELYGEYGAWAHYRKHTGRIDEFTGDMGQDGSLGISKTMERACAFHTAYVSAALDNTDNYCGHFAWVFNNFPTGRGGLAAHESDSAIYKLVPINYKGLLTSWREPQDLFYLYQAYYTSKSDMPMVYICSHTWGDRFDGPREAVIQVYSNCDEVELFNGYKTASLGSKSRPGIAPFQWDNANVQKNLLYAEAKVGGTVVATDAIFLENLPDAGGLAELDPGAPNSTEPTPGLQYTYRINCGGADYTDVNGNVWKADTEWDNNTCGVVSWGDLAQYDELAVIKDVKEKRTDLGSIGTSWIPIRGTRDDELYQRYRWARDKTTWKFAVPTDTYHTVEFHFMEPWYGAGTNRLDCSGWRLFDIAVEGKTYAENFDIWKRVGYGTATKYAVSNVQASDGVLEVSFPKVAANQAIVSAIAVAAQEGLTAGGSRSIPRRTTIRRTPAGFIVSFPAAVNAEIRITRPNGQLVQRSLVQSRKHASIALDRLPAGLYVMETVMPERRMVRRFVTSP